MRSFSVISGEVALAQQFTNLRHDARGAGNLLVHQQFGPIALPTNPSNTQTLTLTINGTAITITFVSTIGSTPGNVLIGASAAATCANLIALLNQPQTTTATGVALSVGNQSLVTYLSWPLSGTTITPSGNNTLLYSPLTSFSVSTTATGGSYSQQKMKLYVEPGVVYVDGTRVIFAGRSTPTVTAPSTNPRIDVLAIDNTGTLSWTTGAENASPTAPTYPANKVALCELYNVVGEAGLYDISNQQINQGYIYNDVRPFLGERMNWTEFASNLIPDADGTRDLGSGSFEWNNLYVKSGIFLNGVSINSQILSSFIAGASITTGQPLCIAPYQSDGGIKLDTTATGTTNSASISVANNTNRMLIVFVEVPTNGASITSVTYNAIAMTQIDAGTEYAGAQPIASFILPAPATGSNTLSITPTSGTAKWTAYSIYNAAQSTTPDAHNKAQNSTANLTCSVTTVANGAIVFSGYGSWTGSGTGLYENALSAGAPDVNSADSSPVFPAGTSISTTINTNGSTVGCILMVSIAPITTPSYRAFPTSTSNSTNQFYDKYTGYIGIAQSSASAGGSVTVATGGVDQNQSGLSPGAHYYLADSSGTFSKSAGTNTRKAGIAVDTTQMLITNIW